MNFRTRIASVAAASIVALSLGTAAFAQQVTTDQVTQEVLAGSLTYSISGGKLSDVQYASTITYGEGDLELSVNGNGNLSGWDLSVQATSDFVYGGTSANGAPIPAANLVLVEAGAPEYGAGQAIDAVNGPVASSASNSSLGEPVSVISSEANYGSGSYTQNLSVSLEVPAYSQAGTYTGVVTVSTTAGPGIVE